MSLLTKIKSLFAPPTRKQLLSEFDTPQRRADFFQSIIHNVLDNPDDILARYASSEGIDLYRKMESSDPVVASALATRRSAVVNRPFTLLSSAADPAVTQYVHDLLDNLTDLNQTLDHALGAFTTGFVPLELFWTVSKGQWFVEKIVPRDPADYRFDAGGNLRLLTKNNPLEGQPVPPLKFIVHRHRGSIANPYGQSVLKSLYWPVTFSRAGWKWWATAIEKYGMPIITASFPASASPEDQTRFEQFVRSLQAHSWSVVPEGFLVELHEAKRATGDDYLPFLQYADTKKFQVILGQNLTAETSSQGSRAQAAVHNLVRQDITLADAANLSATLTDQLIKPAVRLNFNTDSPIPKFKITPAPADDLEKLAKTYDILAKHIKISDRFLRDTFQITE
jgi:phage gp29-like protein